MRKLLKRFRSDTCGAVSADWVVLTAGVAALGAGAASLVFDGSNDLSELIKEQLIVDESGDNRASAAQSN